MELMSGNEAIAQGAGRPARASAWPIPARRRPRRSRRSREGRRVRRVVRQREGGRRGGHGRAVAGGARAVHDEARRRERGGRPAVHCGVHGRGRQARGAGCRRSRHVLVPERAGLALVRTRAAHPLLDPADSPRLCASRARPSSVSERFDMPVIHPLHRARRRTRKPRWSPAPRGRAQGLRERSGEVGHDARVRQARRKVQLKRIDALRE